MPARPAKSAAAAQKSARSDPAKTRDPVDRAQQARALRLPHPRDLGGGARARGHRGEVAPRRAGEHQRRVRNREGRRAISAQPAHLALRTRGLLESRARTHPQTVAPPQGNPSFDWSRRAPRTDPRPARAVLQKRSGESGPRTRQGKESFTTSATPSARATPSGKWPARSARDDRNRARGVPVVSAERRRRRSSSATRAARSGSRWSRRRPVRCCAPRRSRRCCASTSITTRRRGTSLEAWGARVQVQVGFPPRTRR